MALKLDYVDNHPTERIIYSLLESAPENQGVQLGKELLGAALQSRFPGMVQEVAPTVGEPTPDFVVGTTVFFVAPVATPEIRTACISAAERGDQVYLLLPYEAVCEAQAAIEQESDQPVTVCPMDQFIGFLVDRSARFNFDMIKQAVRELFEAYNKRIGLLYGGGPLLIEIPADL